MNFEEMSPEELGEIDPDGLSEGDREQFTETVLKRFSEACKLSIEQSEKLIEALPRIIDKLYVAIENRDTAFVQEFFNTYDDYLQSVMQLPGVKDTVNEGDLRDNQYDHRQIYTDVKAYLEKYGDL